MNIALLLKNINISDYIVNIIYKNIIYILHNNILNIVKNAIQKLFIIVLFENKNQIIILYKKNKIQMIKIKMYICMYAKKMMSIYF